MRIREPSIPSGTRTGEDNDATGRGGLRNRAALASAGGVAVALLLALPYVASAQVVVSLTLVYCLGLAAIGFDLIWGFGGIFSFGQAIFLGIGAYSVGMIAGRQGNAGLLLNLAASAGLGFAAAVLFGFFLFVGRRVGLVFVAIATLVASYIVSELASSWSAIGGETGITGLPYPSLAGRVLQSRGSMYLVALVIMLLSLAVVWLLLHSHLGASVRAVRTDEMRAAHLGYRTVRIKLLVFGLAGALTGVSGGLYAFQLGGVGPDTIGVDMSTQIALWVLLGGTGTLVGGLLGVGILQLAGDYLPTGLVRAWPIVLGVILVIFATKLQEGLFPALVRLGRSTSRITGRAMKRWQ